MNLKFVRECVDPSMGRCLCTKCIKEEEECYHGILLDFIQCQCDECKVDEE